MSMKLKLAAVVGIIAVFAGQAAAHHSFAMFDKEKLITVTGTLKSFEWTNPHCWLHVVAPDSATGKNVEWAFEMGSVPQIAAQGWKADSIKAGDKITVTAHPLKDGSRGGQYESVKFGDGHTLQHE
jgi:maltose-binding protein MalE